MDRKLLLSLWAFLCVLGLVSAKAVVSCKDKKTCKNLRIITTDSREINAGIAERQSAESIDLHGNLLKEFARADVSNANQLKYLNLSYNLLDRVDLQANGHQRQARGSMLQEVDLTYNQLTHVTVPATVKKFWAVRNKLFGVAFDGSTNVEELHLSKNKLDKIPDLSRQTKLADLDLSCNQISVVDFSKLPSSLRSLNLAHNRIYETTASDARISLRSLQFLDLSYNILTIVDESMDAVPNVQDLYLQHNEIVMIAGKPSFSQLKTFDLRQNDLVCNKLNELIQKPQMRSKLIAENTACRYGNLENNLLCCTPSTSPYADRLIRYRKRQQDAIQNSSAIREQGVDCTKYTPSPCDGDDNEVYRVAGAAANDIQSLVSQDKEALEGTLEQQKGLLRQKQSEKAKLDEQKQHLTASLNNLLGYIGELYRKEGLAGASNPTEQLKQIFGSRDNANKQTLTQVNAEELQLQNLLTDITKAEEDLQDLSDKKDRLQADIDTRNATVIEYQTKIKELKVKLGRT